jgi:hypothetical protein
LQGGRWRVGMELRLLSSHPRQMGGRGDGIIDELQGGEGSNIE